MYPLTFVYSSARTRSLESSISRVWSRSLVEKDSNDLPAESALTSLRPPSNVDDAPDCTLPAPVLPFSGKLSAAARFLFTSSCDAATRGEISLCAQHAAVTLIVTLASLQYSMNVEKSRRVVSILRSVTKQTKASVASSQNW